jgi:molecular chaperone GrpE
MATLPAEGTSAGALRPKSRLDNRESGLYCRIKRTTVVTEREKTPKTEAIVDEGEAPSGPPDSPAPPAVELDPLAKAEAEAAKMKDAWIRTAADYDNFRKRTRREIEDSRRAGREELLRELLPVFDNLERAVTSSRNAPDVKAVIDGLSMVLKQFESTLGRAGITKVASTGTTFDPQVHEAIQQVETSDHPPGTVVAEVQPGYMNGERLVRAAMVVVAKPKPAESN